MTTISQHLSQYKTQIPEWLKNFSANSKVLFSEIMSSRIGYYPGCGNDGQLIKLCSQSHTVHTFIYVDYLTKLRDIDIRLRNPFALRGYHLIGRLEFSHNEVLPAGVYPPITTRQPQYGPETFFWRPYFYCIMGVWERDKDLDDNWGVERLAVVFLRADAIDYYYQLFVAQYRTAPWILLLQDHGLGCNYDMFGKGGLLDEIIDRSGVRPKFLLVGRGTRVWDDYCKLDCEPSSGGMHRTSRFLYEDVKCKDVDNHSLNEVWMVSSNPNGKLMIPDHIFAKLGDREISIISNEIADKCCYYKDVIAAHVSKDRRTQVAAGETDIHIFPEELYSSEIVIERIDLTSFDEHLYEECDDLESQEVDSGDNINTGVSRGTTVYVKYGYYGNLQDVYLTRWRSDLYKMVVE